MISLTRVILGAFALYSSVGARNDNLLTVSV